MDRVLAFAALALGRRDLIADLSADDALARLASALDAEPEVARGAFVAFVEAFPAASHGYVELSFAARAYVVHVERRGSGGIGAATSWLTRTVHERPPPAPVFEMPAAPSPAAKLPADLVTRVATFLAPAVTAALELPFASVALNDIHPSWGGRAVCVTGSGGVELIVRERGLVASRPVVWRHRASLSKAGGAALVELMQRVPVRSIAIAPRMGVAGEGSASLTVRDEHGSVSVTKWANDVHPDFDAYRRWLDELAQVVAASTPAEPAHDWSGDFLREVTPGVAFLLAFLPARRVLQTARRTLLEQLASDPDAKVVRAAAFAKKGLEIEESTVVESDARLAALAKEIGMTPASASADAIRPRLTTPRLQAAWEAGMAARLVAISVGMAATVAHLRHSAAEHAALRARVEHLARTLAEAAGNLRARLEDTGLPLVASRADTVQKYVEYTRELTPTTAAGLRQLFELGRELDAALENTAKRLDVPPPAAPTTPPSAEEEQLHARILAEPSNRALRRELADAAGRRNDPRARLIRLQLGVEDAASRREARQLVMAHPEWTKPMRRSARPRSGSRAASPTRSRSTPPG